MEAEAAMQSMNGQWLAGRAIRTNWATRKPPAPRSAGDGNSKPLTFDEVYNQSSPTNCTVYCGGISQGLSDDIMHKTFSQFGPIQEIRVFKDKGYAFIRFATKESATHAIVSVHNTDVNGQGVKCSWGKESGDPNNQQPTQNLATQYGYSNYQQQVPYWYPQGYPTQMQGQYMQGMQGYPYGQYGFQQQYTGMGMQMPAAGAWQTVPAAGQPQMAAAQQQLSQGIQQPGMIGAAYPMQQYQAQ
ncbi:Nucleolysin TIAR [Nymphon striatum]|nr:Nucleolysin TIAR [Nymphon striatum]